MILGHGTLVKLFPNFKGDIQENGIDLRIGEVKQIIKDYKVTGSIDGEKHVPNYYTIKPEQEEYYKFLPLNYYFIVIDRPIHIPKGHIQQYYLRSTFARSGLLLTDAIGDSDFNGTLMVGVYNAGPQAIYAGLNERIIQAVTIQTDGTDKSYNGDYQGDKIYESTKQ